MGNYKKVTIHLHDDVYEEIKSIIEYKNKRDLLFKKEDYGGTVEQFIIGCVMYYLKKIDGIKDLSGIEDLGRPFKLKNNIREILDTKGLTQTELSEMTGINAANISSILKNRNQPSLDYFLRIWIALDCPELDWMFYREDK